MYWVCRFDKDSRLVTEKPYRSDGRHYYAMIYSGYPMENEEIDEEWYNGCDEEKYSDHAPSAEDLNEIQANIRYPREESFYLDYYKYSAVKKNGATVFINPNADDVMAASNTYKVAVGEDAVVLAESQGYACVIFPDLGRAGWINKDYLTCD